MKIKKVKYGVCSKCGACIADYSKVGRCPNCGGEVEY